MRRVVFLDIDGVLNSRATRPSDRAGLRNWLDPVNVAVLNELIDRSEFEIVVTSSWRRDRTVEELASDFAAVGIRRTPAGATPDVGRSGAARGGEIRAWLDAQAAAPDRVVVLDDEFVISGFEKEHVRISSLNGLQREDLGAILARLG